MARRSMKIRNPLHHLLCVVLQEYNLCVGSYDPDHDDLPLQEKEVRETHLQLSHPGDVGESLRSSLRNDVVRLSSSFSQTLHNPTKFQNRKKETQFKTLISQNKKPQFKMLQALSPNAHNKQENYE
jgi:hypothetical protein